MLWIIQKRAASNPQREKALRAAAAAVPKKGERRKRPKGLSPEGKKKQGEKGASDFGVGKSVSAVEKRELAF